MTAHYTSSNGKQHVIAEMADGYIHAALAKLHREEPGRTREIADLAEEVAKREASRQEAGQ